MQVYDNYATYLFSGISGIYALIYEKEIIYIGQSKDIEQRLEYHLNTDTAIRDILAKQVIDGFNTKYDMYLYKTLSMYCFITANYNKIKFAVLEICPIEELNDWEKAFIEEYKPKYNWGGVDVPFHPYY